MRRWTKTVTAVDGERVCTRSVRAAGSTWIGCTSQGGDLWWWKSTGGELGGAVVTLDEARSIWGLRLKAG